MISESENIVARYARRSQISRKRYDPLDPGICMARQEKERTILRWIRTCRIAPVGSKRLLEIGCGSGTNFLDFLRLGFRPENMVGNDLLPERVAAARLCLPSALKILHGDALELPFPNASFHIVYQATLFTSILDRDFQQRLAQKMWDWVIPGGGVLWYDFVYNNPRNPDVKGVSLRRVRELFPHGNIRAWRVTLAPPLARLVTSVDWSLYSVLNSIPLLRTHVLCWIQKT